MTRIRPLKFVHVVYRTRRFDPVVHGYQTVFGAKVQHRNPALAFLTYDDEHHRFAFANLDVLKPAGGQMTGYADPDGNQMEFQVDCFASSEEANAFMEGPHFAASPIGVEYDPEDWLARLRDGVSPSELLIRRTDEPVSPVRGSFAA